MGMANGVTPILRQVWADCGSLLSLHPPAQARFIHQGCHMQGDEGPLGKPLDPHTLRSSALTVLWGLSTEDKGFIQEVPQIKTQIIVMKSK